jgi:Phosphotransferase enzyme family
MMFGGRSMADRVAAAAHEAITDLVESAGLDRVTAVEPLPASGNNRVFRVVTRSGTILVKRYFSRSSDTRDRLDTEFRFAEYVTRAAPGSGPRPIAKSELHHIAAYEFIDGAPFRAGDVAGGEIDAAAEFFEALNAPSARARAGELPLASEAVFSLARHIELIDRRLGKLDASAGHGDDDEAATFLRALTDDWQRLIDRVATLAARLSVPLERELDSSQRCISASDFGFHNALRRHSGGIVFLDFEYAGWDDPTRMLGDFFAQPAVPVPLSYHASFVERCLRALPDSEDLAARAALMRPVYLVKWCCIALGVFDPEILARRTFANPALDTPSVKRHQLRVACGLHHSLKRALHELY